MKLLAAAFATLSLMALSPVQGEETKMQKEVHMVAPALEKYYAQDAAWRCLETPGSVRTRPEHRHARRLDRAPRPSRWRSISTSPSTMA